MASQKGIIFKNKKTRLEESKCSRSLGLDSFSDSVLKFKANATVDAVDEHEENGEEGYSQFDAVDPVSGDKEENFFAKKHTAEDFVKSRDVALSTVVHMRDGSQAELEPFLQQVFGLSPEKYQNFVRKIQKEENPELVLMCTVISAEGLPSKDANGKSDPYCKITILPRSHQNSPQVRQKNIDDWKKTSLVKDVLHTTVRPETLNPIWNEHFELSIKDPKEDLLVIEIWDSDEDQVGVTKIRGLRGLGNFIADLRKGVDDFMGRAFYLLSTIPPKGERKSLDLYSHSAKSKLGSVKVDLRIRGLREGLSQDEAREEHLRLTRAVVDAESRKKGHYCRRWNAQLSQHAHQLLELHAQSCGLNKLQQVGVLLNVLLDYHKSYAVQVATFCDIISHIKQCRHFLPEKALEGRTDKDHPLWVSALFADVHELASYIFDVMKDHLLVFDLKKVSGVRRMESHLMALREMFSFHAFTLKLNEKHKSLAKAMETSIMSAVTKAFTFLNSKSEPLRNDPEDRLRAFKGLVQHWLHQTQRCLKDIVPLFTEIDVDYMSWYFRALDPLLSSEAAWLERYRAASEDSHTMTFELYLAMRELSNLTEHVKDESLRSDLKLRSYHVWFSPMVSNWISLAQTLCRRRIDKAIEIDEVMQITNGASFSSSAVDTKGFLLQVGAFWKNLEWPMAPESYSFAAAIVQHICDCAVYYVGKVYTRVTDEDIYKNGKFHASEKLCIILNNMCHLQQALEGLSESLELDKYYKWLEEQDKMAEQKSDKVAAKAQGLIANLLMSAEEDIGNKISLIVQNVSQKVNIQHFVWAMMSSSKEVPDQDTIAPLLDYLTDNLQTLGDFLLDRALSSILANLWESSITALSSSLLTIPKKQGSKYVQARLHFALQMLREFYYAGGSGLSITDLDTPEYKKLLGDMELTGLPTPKLILRFQTDLFQQCNAGKEKASRGTLTVSVAYLKHRSAVEVTVVAAKNLPGLDKSGLSDPFVEMSLHPRSLFIDKQVKTTTKKQTVDPVYNEEFLLPVSKPETMEVDGAMLLLAVFDYDKMSSNDLCGLCVIPCKRIPKLAGRGSITKPTGPERKNYHLPLFMVQPTLAFRELEARNHAGDSEAQHFFKAFKPYLDELAPSIGRGRLSRK
jgi:BAI1-associated protein 3